MKSLITFLIGLATALAALMADPSMAAEPAHESRPLAQSITAVRLRGSIDLEITQSDTQSLTIEGRPDQLTRVHTEVRGSELLIDYDSPMEIHLGTHNRHEPRAILSAKTLERLKVEGSGDVSIESWKTAGDLDLSLSGSGDATIDSLEAHNLHVAIQGSDDVKIGRGRVDAVSLQIRGSGDFDAADLRTASATVSIAGSGDAVLWATQSLTVSIAGSGDVSYYGHPTLSQQMAGSGDLTALGDK